MKHIIQAPAAFFLLAFICTLFPVNAWQMEWFMGAVLCLFTFSALMLTQKMPQGWDVPNAKILLIPCAFWALSFASIFWSEVKPVALTAFCFFSFLPLTFFTLMAAGDKNFVQGLIKPLIFIFALLSAWAVFQFFFLNGYFQGQARHPLADPSSLGALLSLALFCALGWIAYGGGKRAVILAALLTCGILSTVARGPIFAFVPGIFLFSIFLWPKIKEHRKEFLMVLLAALAFFGLMQTGVQKKYDLGTRIFGTVTMAGEDVSNNRLDVWKSSIEMIKDRPMLGTGVGTFFLYYPEYRRDTETDGAMMAHNDPLQFWVEMGILSPLLFYAFVIAAATRSLRAIKKQENFDADKIITVTIFSALASMVAGAHVGFNHYNLAILLMTGVMLFVWLNASGKILGQGQKILSLPKRGGKILVAMPFIMTGFLFFSIMGGEYMASRARDAMFMGQMNKFADDINASGRISQGLNYRAYLFAVNVPIAILDDRKSTLKEDQQKKLYDQVVDYMNKVLALNPRAGTAYYYLGKVQGMVRASVVPKDTPSAQSYFEKALALDPANLGARMAIYNIMKEQKKPNDEILKFLQEGEAFYYTTPLALEFYGVLANAYLEAKNYGKMQEVVARVADYQRRSDFSLKRQNTAIPQAIMGGPDMFVAP